MENEVIKILAIDDIQDNLISINALIKDTFSDALVFTALDGKRGLELANAEDPDVILLDIVMPNMDGYEVCQQLKNNSQTQDIPIVFVTALKGDSQSRIRALDVGGEAFLSKPIDEPELIAQIRAMVKIKKATIAKKSEKEELERLVKERTLELQAELTERKRTESKLIKTQELLSQTSRMAKVGGWEINLPDGEFNWSEITREIHEVDPEFVPDFQKNMLFYKEGKDRDSIELLIKNAIEKGDPYDVELEIVTAKGNKRWIRTIGNAAFNNGKCERLYGTFQDIDDKKKAEEKIRQASENWNITFNAISDGIALLNIDQQVIQSNQPFRDFIEKTGGDLLSMDCFPLVRGSEIQVEDCPFLRMKKSKKREKMEIQLNDRFYEILVDPIFDDKGNITGAVHINSDITDRKKVEEALLESELQYRRLADSGTALIWTVDSNMKCNYVNEPMLRFTGSTLDVDQNNDWMSRIHPDDFDYCIERFNDDFEKRQPFELEYRLKNAHDEYRWVIDMGTPNYNIGGEFIGYIGYCFDITDRKKMEFELYAAKEKAVESERLKSAFLANMSHEIRTPMNGIVGFVELLQSPEISAEQHQLYVNIVKQSSERLLNTINDIIEISRIEAEQSPIHYSEVNMNKVMNYLHEFFMPEASAKHLSFSMVNSFGNENFTIITDENKLVSILTNLLKNSIKFTNSGFIEFGNQLQNDVLSFYVKDSGIGIPGDKLNVIFDRFVQADLAITRPYEGSGLGLSIAKAYVEMLGGKIEVESEMDKGTTIRFTINFNPAKQKENNTFQKISPVEKGSKASTVLIAEDDDASFSYLEVLLSRKNYQLLRAKNGKEAIQLFNDNPKIDLILMDLKMPVMDGYEATRQIREFNNEIPIVAQTAFALTGDKEKALEAGCTDYISKPVKGDELMEKIRLIMNEAV